MCLENVNLVRFGHSHAALWLETRQNVVPEDGWGQAVRSRVGGILVAFALLLGAGSADGTELLSMPYACEVKGGRLVLTPSAERSYEILGSRQEQTYTACPPDRSGRCRTWAIHRFAMACTGGLVRWIDVAAAQSQKRNGMWVDDDRVHVRVAGRLRNRGAAPCERPYLRSFNQFEAGPAAAAPCPEPAESVYSIRLPSGYAPIALFGARILQVTEPAPQPNVAAAKDPLAPGGYSQGGAKPAAVARAPDTGKSVDTLMTSPAKPPEAPLRLVAADRDAEADLPPSAGDRPAGKRSVSEALKVLAAGTSLPALEPSAKVPVVELVHRTADAVPVMVAEYAAEDAGARDSVESVRDLDGQRSPWVTVIELEPHVRAVLTDTAVVGAATVAAGLGLLSLLLWRTWQGRYQRVPTGVSLVKRPTAVWTSQESLPDARMCVSLSRTAEGLIGQVDVGLQSLGSAPELRHVLLREARYASQRLEAVAMARPDDEASWRKMRNILQRVVTDLGRLKDITHAATRSLSGLAEHRDPPRDKAEAYEALGVNSDVSDKILKKLVDALRAAWHPDHSKDEMDRRRREDRIKEINIAWDLISGKRQET